MKSTVFVTGADRGLGLALCSGLLERGWLVFAGQYMPQWPELSALATQYPQTLTIVPLDVSSLESTRAAARAVEDITDHIDVLINNAAVIGQDIDRSIREGQDYADLHQVYDVNALGSLRMVETFLPLTDRGNLKRLCFISSEAGSITRSERTAWFGYCMSKAALNMAAMNLFNHLHPEGYTFRVYHPGWMRTYIKGQMDSAATLSQDEAAAKAIPLLLGQRKDEDQLVMIDWEGNEWPW